VKRAETFQKDVGKRLESQVDDVLGRLNIASTREVARLNRKVASLNKKIAALEKADSVDATGTDG